MGIFIGDLGGSIDEDSPLSLDDWVHRWVFKDEVVSGLIPTGSGPVCHMNGSTFTIKKKNSRLLASMFTIHTDPSWDMNNILPEPLKDLLIWDILIPWMTGWFFATWKIWGRQLGLRFPIYDIWKKNMFQTSNQMIPWVVFQQNTGPPSVSWTKSEKTPVTPVNIQFNSGHQKNIHRLTAPRICFEGKSPTYHGEKSLEELYSKININHQSPHSIKSRSRNSHRINQQCFFLKSTDISYKSWWKIVVSSSSLRGTTQPWLHPFRNGTFPWKKPTNHWGSSMTSWKPPYTCSWYVKLYRSQIISSLYLIHIPLLIHYHPFA